MRERKEKEYLRTIYLLSSCGAVRGSYIAKEMMVSRPAVSVALKALAEKNYITVDPDYQIHLTESGEQMAKDSICEAVNLGNDFSEIADQIQSGSDATQESMEKRKEKQLLRFLSNDRIEDILEAILILSRRYYSVRTVDLCLFLERSYAKIRSAIERLEKYQLASRGEESTVKLTESGRKLAEQLYKKHEGIRSELIKNGLEAFDAERESLFTR